MGFRLGIDLGGTSAKIALVSPSHKIVKEGSVATAGFPNVRSLTDEMAAVCKQLAAGRRVDQVGVGVAGDIDSHKGVVRISPNLGWKNVPLKALIEKKSRLKTTVDNDANAAAWGIYNTQVSKKIQSLIVMTLGTGVGGGIILDGKLLKGATGSAGEIGHVNIEEDGPLCNCGNRGCLETYVGGPHLVKRVRADLEKGQASRLRAIFNEDPDQLTPHAISVAAKQGDKYALSIWNGVGHALGVGIGDLIYVLNPEMIVFTGGVAQAKDLILKPLWATLRRRAFQTPVSAVQIKVAANAAHAGVIGASLL